MLFRSRPAREYEFGAVVRACHWRRAAPDRIAEREGQEGVGGRVVASALRHSSSLPAEWARRYGFWSDVARAAGRDATDFLFLAFKDFSREARAFSSS